MHNRAVVLLGVLRYGNYSFEKMHPDKTDRFMQFFYICFFVLKFLLFCSSLRCQNLLNLHISPWVETVITDTYFIVINIYIYDQVDAKIERVFIERI